MLGRSTLANLDEADDDDEPKRQELGRGKEVLHSGGRLHAVAVHKRQQDCRQREKERQSRRVREQTVSGGILMKHLVDVPPLVSVISHMKRAPTPQQRLLLTFHNGHMKDELFCRCFGC